ncbi:MAG: phosphomannomutase/phosphoglucomutase [bacterium]|nr:phosphomannomutase/phosphoglucomutase [bacterium]
MVLNPNVFRAYDIRGLYPAELNEDFFYDLAKGLCSFLLENKKYFFLRRPKIVVGQDLRASSSFLADAFIDGILDFGFDVVDIGRATTPMSVYAVHTLNCVGGAMITASHNARDYNGIKFLDKSCRYIGGEEFLEFFKRIKSKNNYKSKRGKYKETDISVSYLDFLTRGLILKRKLKIVVDASGGVAGLFLNNFLKKMKIDYIPLFFESDPFFEKHNPNPLLLESQFFVKEKIKETGADFGVIFDGDADRIVFVDEKSDCIRGDAAGGIVADSFLKKGDTFVRDTVSTMSLGEYFEKKGVKNIISNVGRFYMRKAMEKNKAVFGSEMSGHYYFKKLHYSESAFLMLRLVLEELDKKPNLQISDLVKPFLKYFHSDEIFFPLAHDDAWPDILEKIKKQYQTGRQSFDDGIKVEYDDWWFVLRPSNTEPVVRLCVEATNQNLFEEKKKEIFKLLL